jgi:hypothetical protein
MVAAIVCADWPAAAEQLLNLALPLRGRIVLYRHLPPAWRRPGGLGYIIKINGKSGKNIVNQYRKTSISGTKAQINFPLRHNLFPLKVVK